MDFPQLHVSTKDGNDVVEVTGVIVDLTDDTTGKRALPLQLPKQRAMRLNSIYWLMTIFFTLMKEDSNNKNTILQM